MLTISNKTILITGAAGFIDANLVLELLKTQPSVYIIGIDNLNDSEIEKETAVHPDSK